MDNQVERRYCQSCGMPLDLSKTEYLGTNADHSHSEEFCYYCLKDGEYIVDYSLEQMVDVWVKYTDKYNGYVNTCYQPEELRALLKKRLPTLGRWRQKANTIDIHSEVVNRISIFINQHLFESLDTGLLAIKAGMSLFHFRRVFREVTGENVGSYIQRLRLEYIAYKLISSDISLMELINQIHVYTKHSLSKAFHKHFGLSPSQYRKRFRLTENAVEENIENKIQPQIKRLRSLSVLYLQVGQAYTDIRTYTGLWNKLVGFAEENRLTSSLNKFLSLSMDDPLVTHKEKCRFYLGITIDGDINPCNPFGVMNIPDGLYAVFRHNGRHEDLPAFYRGIYLNWLPASGYRQKDTLTFEIYMNSPRQVSPTELITDIYIPVEKIKL